jgi:hypothetical protein
MQIKTELGCDNHSNDNLRSKPAIKNNPDIEDKDISSKISALLRELNDMELKSNKLNPTLSKSKREEIPPNTKNINEFKLSIMVKNKLNDDVKKSFEPKECMQNNGKLLRIIKNPKTLISEKTKTCIDRLLHNGIVDYKISNLY